MSLISLFWSPSRGPSDLYSPSSPSDTLHRSGTLSRGSLNRGGTIIRRLQNVGDVFLRAFTLRGPPSYYRPGSAYHGAPSQMIRSDSYPLEHATNLPEETQIRRQASDSTYSSQVHQSDSREILSLPFRLNINHIHEKAHRNVPYLRQSWTRIDFVAIVSFWITFGLAMSGLERGRFHIGIFRALSVIRTARLLTITSGTTVRLLLPNEVTSTTNSIDYHAFSENCASAPYPSRLFCHFRYRAFLVRSSLPRHFSSFI